MVRESVVDWSGAVGKPLYHADQTVADRLEGPVAMLSACSLNSDCCGYNPKTTARSIEQILQSANSRSQAS